MRNHFLSKLKNKIRRQNERTKKYI